MHSRQSFTWKKTHGLERSKHSKRFPFPCALHISSLSGCHGSQAEAKAVAIRKASLDSRAKKLKEKKMRLKMQQKMFDKKKKVASLRVASACLTHAAVLNSRLCLDDASQGIS